MPLYPLYEEQQLLADLRKGDHAAFTSIYDRYWRRLYGLAYTRLKSKHAAEDVVQEVLSSLWLRHEVLEIKSLEAYLAAATKYAIIRQLANWPLYPNILHEPQQTQVYNPDPDFLQQLFHNEINRLPKKCKLVFLYSRNDGLSYKEIAGKMEISEKAVEKHITKALSKLRRKTRDFFHLFTVL